MQNFAGWQFENDSKNVPDPMNRHKADILTQLRTIVEAVAWAISFQLTQLIAIGLFLALLITATFGLSWPPASELISVGLELKLDQSFLPIAVSTLGALFLLVPLIRFRVGQSFREQIGLHLPRHEEVIFAIATVIPIAFLGDVLYTLTHNWVSTGFFRRQLQLSMEADSLTFLSSRINGVPFPMLVVAMALGPAIGEELLFRGLISKLLTNRLGRWTGSTITVLLFALAHMSPAHAIATLPIACLLQFLYLKTGTIWVPILIHFLNNLLGVAIMKYGASIDFPASVTAVAFTTAYLLSILIAFEFRHRSWTQPATS